MAKFNEEDGVWRTIGGRRVFIKDGQSLSDAMRESGKFKSNSKSQKIGDERDKKFDNYIDEQKNKTEGGLRRIIHESDDETEKMSAKKLLNDMKKEDENIAKALNDPKEKNLNIDPEAYAEKIKEPKTEFEKLAKEYKDTLDMATKYNTERKNMYEGFDEEKAKNHLSESDYKKYQELTEKYNTERGKLDGIYKNMEKEFNEGRTPTNKEMNESINKSQPKHSWDDDFEQGKSTKSNDSKVDVPGFKNYEYDTKTGEARVKGYDEKDAEKRANELRNKLAENRGEKEKATNDIMNKAIREKANKKNEVKEDLPKHVEIKEQGTSNRKEVSENIQAHILEYYDSPQDFVEQMDAMDHLPTKWKAGEELAKGGSYLIYNGDMSDFLDELKINPKGKKFSEDKAFDMYTSLIGRESSKLYDRIQKNSYNKYMKEHPLSKMSFEEFKNMNKK